MKLFKKLINNKSNSKVNAKIDMLDEIQIKNDLKDAQFKTLHIQETNEPISFNNWYNQALESSKKLLYWEEKYPKAFNISPCTMVETLINTRNELERDMIDRWIHNLERTLIQYSTEKGKMNNFKKQVDLFKFDSEVLLPESIDYFQSELEKHYSQYIN